MTHEEIHTICKEYCIRNYTINPDGSIAPKTPIIPSSNNGAVISTEDANAKIQAQKDADAKLKADALKNKQEELTANTTEAQNLTAKKVADDLKKAMGGTVAPNAYSSADLLKTLQSEQGTTAIQEHINTINTEINNLEASYKAGMIAQGNELAPMDLITSRQKELTDQYNSKLDTLQNNKKTLIDEYNLKVNNINAIMDMKKLDYNTAKSDYDTRFNQAISIMGAANTLTNTATDNARANWSAIMGSLKGADMASLSPEMKASLSALESQMGLPSGITDFIIENSADDEEVVSSSVIKDDNDNPTGYNVLYRDAQGNLKTKIVGFSGGGGGDQNVISSSSIDKAMQAAYDKTGNSNDAYDVGVAFAEAKGWTLSEKELNLIRQWFNMLEDAHKDVLEHDDFNLGMKITQHLKFTPSPYLIEKTAKRASCLIEIDRKPLDKFPFNTYRFPAEDLEKQVKEAGLKNRPIILNWNK